MATKTREELRVARHNRLRKKVEGTAARPRLAVFRSLNHIYAQLIDDTVGHTIVACSSQEKGMKNGGNLAGAKEVGTKLAEKAKAAGIKSAVFDRGGFRYAGRVASLAEGAREGGLEF
ncbi:MAG: 50S ribosomal protein L18 [Armatimonadetes bacterium]|nr:50S ribosomal protein L18 [Armatimonadota bacterium]